MAVKKTTKTKKTAKKKREKLPPRLIKYLEKAGVKHEVLEHKTVYTAIDAAATLKKKINEVAKSLLVKADKDYYLILLPADNNLDLEKLKKEIGKARGQKVKVVKIPSEKVMSKALKIKAGALSAFGALHKVPVMVDKKLEKVKKAAFSAGSANHSIEMAVRDFIKLEQAVLGNFGVKKKIKKAAKKKPASRKKPVSRKK